MSEPECTSTSGSDQGLGVRTQGCQDGAAVALGGSAMKDDTQRTQCFWMPPWLAKLYAERAAYECAGRPRAVVTTADIEAELAEVARRLGRSR